MSITSALSSALTGLSATSRQAEVVSSNVANATTPGYARREVQLGAAVLAGSGQGVAVLGVSRDTNQYLINERRLSQAGDADRSQRAEFLKRVEMAIGTPDMAKSLSARIAAFDQSLIEASSRPDSEARLAVVASSARFLAEGLNRASGDIQQARVEADHAIARDVDHLNAALHRVYEINGQLQGYVGAGYDVSALLDQRQQIIDSISAIIPLRETPRGMNQVALYTIGGVALLDGPPATFSFTQTSTITPEMSVDLGGLSGLRVNGRPLDTGGSTSPILGGRLAAQFAIRDDLAVTAQGKLDAIARDLVERFSVPGRDPTLAPGDAGLFTDRGSAFVTADETGLAGRVSLNAAVDPSRGGALYRLRDGLGATTQGPPGNAALLTGLQHALVDARPLTSSGVSPGARSFAALASHVLSDVSVRRLGAEDDAAYSSARLTALRDMENQGGVDTDQEMQMLLVIEKNYSANARVIQAVSNMIDTLLRLGS